MEKGEGGEGHGWEKGPFVGGEFFDLLAVRPLWLFTLSILQQKKGLGE